MKRSTSNSKTIKASPHAIYEALTDPKALVTCQVPGEMTAKIKDFDLKVGGGYVMSLFYPASYKEAHGKTSAKEDRFTATFTELVPNKKIVQTTVFDTTNPAFKGEMYMKVTLEKKGNGTKVTFLFKNLPKGIKAEDNQEGTRSSLKKLADYVETKKTDAKQMVFFAHSAGPQAKSGEGSHDLVKHLEEDLGEDYTVDFPLIADLEKPTYSSWKRMFTTAFKKIKEPVVLIGHSLGGSMLLKYLSEEKPKLSILGLFLVAVPQWGKTGWNSKEFMLKPNFEKTLKGIPNVFLYQSVNDTVVPVKHLEFYKKAFESATVRTLKGKDHVFKKGFPELVHDIKMLQS